MGNLIQSLSQTPLPTILVAAGILFLFIGIGGHLGAQIATDTIKRKLAGALGGVLLVCGISFYFGGQLNNYASKEISSPSKTVKESTCQLRANTLPPGRITESQEQFSMLEATLTVQSGDDQIIVGKMSIESGDSTRCEILSSSGGQPITLKETILSDVTKTTTSIADNNTTETEEGVFSGHSVLIEKKGGTWIKSLLGAEPTEEQKAELREPYADEYETYPSDSVKVGTTWTLGGAAVGIHKRLRELAFC